MALSWLTVPGRFVAVQVAGGLQSSRKVVWHHMQTRIAHFLQAAPVLAAGKKKGPEHSLLRLTEVVCTCKIMIQIGNEFSRDVAPDLEEAMKGKAKVGGPLHRPFPAHTQ